MSTQVSESFIKQFEAEVHLCYQQNGSKLRNTVRYKNGVKGSSTVFQKVGKGIASQKARHGLVPVMSLDHSPVECELQDYYAGDWVDALDELKLSIDERRVIANSGAYALGRKTDELIIGALSQAGSANDVGDYAEVMGKKDILKGTESRKWLGINWIMHTGLPLNGTSRDCFIFHKTAVGHACGQEVKSDISWHGDHAAHFVNNMMSQGACLIDETGVVRIKCKEASI